MSTAFAVGEGSTSSGGNITISVGVDVDAGQFIHVAVAQDGGAFAVYGATATDSQGNAWSPHEGTSSYNGPFGGAVSLCNIITRVTNPLTTADKITVVPVGTITWTNGVANATGISLSTGGTTFSTGVYGTGSVYQTGFGPVTLTVQPFNGSYLSDDITLVSVASRPIGSITGNPTGDPADWGVAIQDSTQSTLELRTFAATPASKAAPIANVVFPGTIVACGLIAFNVAPGSSPSSQGQIIG